MSQPKKKTSRARRDKRRYSPGHQVPPVTWTTSPFTHDPIRPHRATLETVDEYVAARQESKKKK